jgi:hypothetical protein
LFGITLRHVFAPLNCKPSDMRSVMQQACSASVHPGS